MANDNYVKREKYNGLAVIGGQVIPLRGDVPVDELMPTEVVEEEAHYNGGGTKPGRKVKGE